MNLKQIQEHLKAGEIIESKTFLFKLNELGRLVYKGKYFYSDWKPSIVEFKYPRDFRVYKEPKEAATNSVKGQLAANAIINGTYF